MSEGRVGWKTSICLRLESSCRSRKPPWQAALLAGQGLRLARETSQAAEIIASQEEVDLALRRLIRPG